MRADDDSLINETDWRGIKTTATKWPPHDARPSFTATQHPRKYRNTYHHGGTQWVASVTAVLSHSKTPFGRHFSASDEGIDEGGLDSILSPLSSVTDTTDSFFSFSLYEHKLLTQGGQQNHSALKHTKEKRHWLEQRVAFFTGTHGRYIPASRIINVQMLLRFELNQPQYVSVYTTTWQYPQNSPLPLSEDNQCLESPLAMTPATSPLKSFLK